MLCGVDIPPLEAHQRSLQDRIAVICGHRNVADAHLVAVVAEAVETGSWFMAGIKTPEHFVAWQTGSSTSRSYHLVAVARRRHDLPLTYASFERGELSFDQIATIAAHAPAWADAELAAFARNATVSQIRQAIRKYPWPDVAEPEPAMSEEDGAGDAGDNTDTTDPADDAPDAAETSLGAKPWKPWPGLCLPPSPTLANRPPSAMPHDLYSLTFDEHGRFRLVVEGDATDGAIIDQAVKEAHDRLFRDGQTELTWVDALVDVANRSVGAITNPERADRYRVYVHLDTNGAWLNAGPTIPESLFQLLSCNATMHALWETDGQPVNIGRKHHAVPNHTRRIIFDRDRTCRHPACNATRHLHIHHVIHWINGGPTDTHNLVALCPYHHRGLHRHHFTIAGNADQPDGLIFHTNGNPITTPAARPPNGPPPAPPPGHTYAHPSGERLNTWAVGFNPPKQTAA